jgi:hypothetical protein
MGPGSAAHRFALRSIRGHGSPSLLLVRLLATNRLQFCKYRIDVEVVALLFGQAPGNDEAEPWTGNSNAV